MGFEPWTIRSKAPLWKRDPTYPTVTRSGVFSELSQHDPQKPSGFYFLLFCGLWCHTSKEGTGQGGQGGSVDWSGHTCWQRRKEAKLKDQAGCCTRTPSRGLGTRAHSRQPGVPAPTSLALSALLPGPPSVSLCPAFPPPQGSADGGCWILL